MLLETSENTHNDTHKHTHMYVPTAHARLQPRPACLNCVVSRTVESRVRGLRFSWLNQSLAVPAVELQITLPHLTPPQLLTRRPPMWRGCTALQVIETADMQSGVHVDRGEVADEAARRVCRQVQKLLLCHKLSAAAPRLCEAHQLMHSLATRFFAWPSAKALYRREEAFLKGVMGCLVQAALDAPSSDVLLIPYAPGITEEGNTCCKISCKIGHCSRVTCQRSCMLNR